MKKFWVGIDFAEEGKDYSVKTIWKDKKIIKQEYSMTTEEKNLLLKDICARLPYGVRVRVHDINVDDYDVFLHESLLSSFKIYMIEIKPYLRKMSTMTDEEKEELKKYLLEDEKIYIDIIEGKRPRGTGVLYHAADYLNSIHVDYRGLIDIGLALEAPKNMYKLC